MASFDLGIGTIAMVMLRVKIMKEILMGRRLGWAILFGFVGVTTYGDEVITGDLLNYRI